MRGNFAVQRWWCVKYCLLARFAPPQNVAISLPYQRANFRPKAKTDKNSRKTGFGPHGSGNDYTINYPTTIVVELVCV